MFREVHLSHASPVLVVIHLVLRDLAYYSMMVDSHRSPELDTPAFLTRIAGHLEDSEATAQNQTHVEDLEDIEQPQVERGQRLKNRPGETNLGPVYGWNIGR